MRSKNNERLVLTGNSSNEKMDNEVYDGGKGKKINQRNRLILNFMVLMIIAFFGGIAATKIVRGDIGKLFFLGDQAWIGGDSINNPTGEIGTGGRNLAFTMLENEIGLLRERMIEVQGLSTKLLEEEAGYISDAIGKSKDFLKSEYDSIKDYYVEDHSRPNVRLKQRELSIAGIDSNEKNTILDEKGSAILLVGGSDGSGTRSAVDVLQKLGVAMAVDDTGTMDVHGQEMKGGWPPSVTKVLKATHSGNYEVNEFPTSLKEEILTDLNKFFSTKSRSMRSKVKKTSKIDWGFKAPVSMLLVPFFHHMTSESKQGLKFLHMIRDGRDLAFSGNQSPVRKFYDTFYDGNSNVDKNEDGPLKAIRLWSDWNTEVETWSSSHVDGETFDYLKIRTEDLVHPDTKYDAYKRIADFVGSPYTDEQICCMVEQPNKFMGSHSTSQKNLRSGQDFVQSRYGHWKEKTKGNLVLENKLQSLGEKGLRQFRYLSSNQLPPHELKYPASQCQLSKEDCRHVNMTPKIIKENNKGLVTKCQFFQGALDIRGPGIDIGVDHASSKEECCMICQGHTSCKQFTFHSEAKLCYLKTLGGTQTPSSGSFLVSGSYV